MGNIDVRLVCCILISKSIQRNFKVRVLFRFQPDYVNPLIFQLYLTLLQNLLFGGLTWDDVINHISAVMELRRLVYKL